MYGYVGEYEPLTIENILSRISQEDIFSSLLGGKPDINKTYLSLTRPDNTPNCNFVWYDGKLLFIDFGNTKTHLDCFGVIGQREGLSLQETLTFVNDKFQLGLAGMGTPKDTKFKSVKKIDIIKSETSIIFKPRPYTIPDLRYWNDYGIDKDELMSDSVFAVLWYKFYSKRLGYNVVVRPQTLTYAYYEFSPRVKIYSPFAPKKNGKWISSATIDDIGNIKNLPMWGELLVITKSYKDCRCLRNFGINSTWFQNEGMIPSDKYILNLGKRFMNIVVLYDNDSQGIMSANKIVQHINSNFPNKAKSLIIPLMDKVKDPSDMYKYQGKIELLKYLTINNLI